MTNRTLHGELKLEVELGNRTNFFAEADLQKTRSAEIWLDRARIS